MKNACLRFLRPCLAREAPPIRRSTSSAYARFYSIAAQPQQISPVRQRLDELEQTEFLKYPRVKNDKGVLTCEGFRLKYRNLEAGAHVANETVTIRGRVHSSRIAGSKLVFFDLVQDGSQVQGLCNLNKLADSGVTREQFKSFYHILRRGDIFSLTGIPHRTGRGELSIEAVELPSLLSPSIHQLPDELTDVETRKRNRHVDLLVNKESVETLKLRSLIIQYIRNFLLNDGFLEVETPILADAAGGAVARPFRTNAVEFPERGISLRIAPELWLKRLVLGGMDRIFEIGPNFRNEGLDGTHNPEFTTCEFYKSFADLEDLIKMTEKMLSGLSSHVNNLKETKFTSLPALNLDFSAPFKRLDFIPALEEAIGRRLPDLSGPDASDSLVNLMGHMSVPLPAEINLPRLLDKLASVYIEPQCVDPTFVCYHPESLSPLSKSFEHPTNRQKVAARVELFAQGRELVNAYEEENSPQEQRRKFLLQASYRDAEDESGVDENYLQALEWGLPPTGGWGCGLDRLCMMFSGASRIGDVLSFGNLRNVVALGRSMEDQSINHEHKS